MRKIFFIGIISILITTIWGLAKQQSDSLSIKAIQQDLIKQGIVVNSFAPDIEPVISDSAKEKPQGKTVRRAIFKCCGLHIE